MDERCKAAFESVRDTAKQLIGLATGVLALTVTFSKDLLGSATSGRTLVHVAWYLLLISAAAGVWVLLAVTGSLGASGRQIDHTTVYARNIAAPAFIQVLSMHTPGAMMSTLAP